MTVTSKQLSNLQPPRTKTEARERGKNGGLKSGEARRKKRTLKEIASILLNTRLNESVLNGVSIPDIFPDLPEELGEITPAIAICTKVIKLAFDGDLKACELLRDTIDGKPPVMSSTVSLGNEPIRIYLDGEPYSD